MTLLIAIIGVVYFVGLGWFSRALFRSIMHERHQWEEYGLGRPIALWEYVFQAACAVLWPVPLTVFVLVDCFDAGVDPTRR